MSYEKHFAHQLYCATFCAIDNRNAQRPLFNNIRVCTAVGFAVFCGAGSGCIRYISLVWSGQTPVTEARPVRWWCRTMADADGTLALERVEFSDESDGDFKYAAVSDDDDLLATDSEEDIGLDDDGADGLGVTLASLTKRRDGGGRRSEGGDDDAKEATERPVTAVRPTVVDDYIRNFLIRHGFDKTLDMFNTEWYAKKASGNITTEDDDFEPVPDLYVSAWWDMWHGSMCVPCR